MIDCRPSRRAARRREIQEQACRLVIERGYDGFTMDDLAAAVGVSRRTLFNHVTDKATAVLGGERDGAIEEDLTEFVAGGPTGNLLADVVAAVRAAIVSADAEDCGTVDRLHLTERAIAADPKVAGIASRRFEESFERVGAVVCRREGWVEGDLRAQLLVARVIAVVKVVLVETRRRRGTRSFVDIFDEVVAAEIELYSDDAVRRAAAAALVATAQADLPSGPAASA